MFSLGEMHSLFVSFPFASCNSRPTFESESTADYRGKGTEKRSTHRSPLVSFALPLAVRLVLLMSLVIIITKARVHATERVMRLCARGA